MCRDLTVEQMSGEIKQFIVTEHNKLRNAVAAGQVPTFPTASRMMKMVSRIDFSGCVCVLSICFHILNRDFIDFESQWSYRLFINSVGME